MYTPEENALLAQLRSKAALGTITKEELAKAIEILAPRRLAAARSAAQRRAAARQTRSADDLLEALGEA